MRLLGVRNHLVLDAVAIAVFAIAPTAFALGRLGTIVSYVLAVAHLGLTAATMFPPAEARRLIAAAHPVVELTVALALLAASRLLQWGPTDRAFFLVMGVVILAVWLVTDYGAFDTVGARRPA